MLRMTPNGLRRFFAGVAAIVLLCILWLSLDFFGIAVAPFYTNEDFSLPINASGTDFNQNGIDDTYDLLIGARKDAQNHPVYDGSYVSGGYPPENRGVCTDVVWRAFREAGYSLKQMVDTDIRASIEDYPRTSGIRDANIDFRRVPNLRVFFSKYAQSLTTDPYDIGAWQAGDIVTFGDSHIGIISDRRNAKGIPFLIHNSGQPHREEDALLRCGTISGHFRFDGASLPKELQISFSYSE